MTDPEYLTVVQAAKLAPGRPSANAIWRWAAHGIKTPTGRVYLRHLRMGGKLLTTSEWIIDFGLAMAEAYKVTEPPPVVRMPCRVSSARRAKQIAEARAELARA